MKIDNQPIASLQNLLDFEASNFISAEIQLKKSLPEWINSTASLKFKAALQKYLDFVKQHIDMLDNFFEYEEIVSLSLTNRVMQAFIEEATEKLTLCTDAEIKDACLLASIQAINHYKISAYGTAAAFTNALGMEKQAAVFHEAEINEKQIDDRLSQLAEHEINSRAKAPFALPE